MVAAYDGESDLTAVPVHPLTEHASPFLTLPIYDHGLHFGVIGFILSAPSPRRGGETEIIINRAGHRVGAEGPWSSLDQDADPCGMRMVRKPADPAGADSLISRVRIPTCPLKIFKLFNQKL